MNRAVLTNDNTYTIFKFGEYTVRYKSPYSLEYYSSIKEWDNGYIVVMTKYKHSEELIEEYIDLTPILDDLYIEKEEFLSPIKEVVIDDKC